MTRLFAFAAALLLTALTVSSSCVALPSSPLRFTLEEPNGATNGTVQLTFRQEGNGDTHFTSNSFLTKDLGGLDLAALRGGGSGPIRFAVAGDPGRVDCTGTGGSGRASGTCQVVANPSFNAFLAASGIRQPTESETFSLIAVGANRATVTALADARYPVPSIDDLTDLAALDVSPGYIRALSSGGYRPQTIDDLVEFAALGITPAYVEGFVRAGYGQLKAHELVELKALAITPDYVAGFERAGYRNLPVDTLVELKALDITPDFVRAVQRGGPLPSPDRLILLRSVGQDISKQAN
ncbi:hypothetical protein H8M03_02300 [Sphingomonas sabuli]|uniref:Uncharacterized protein n=1 Tax=Sphingomonas sabuli TaxID=2764186 RepID=A0A7G9L3K7_9SPHN|nr:hypothetical protein [Sphingomonas sabuli]QNM83206.1 hypothetical protein H8M03_02300 [Sphingomonas sabuli]